MLSRKRGRPKGTTKKRIKTTTVIRSADVAPLTFRRLKYNTDVSLTFTVDALQFENDSLVETKFDHTYSINQCDGMATWLNHYDQYRIDKVVITMRAVGPTEINRPYDDSTAGNPVNNVPRWAVCIDYDAGDSSSSFDTLKNRQNSRVFLATSKKQTFTFKPTPLTMLYNGIGSTAYAPEFGRKWVDCSYSTMPHYGLKGALEAASPTKAYQTRMSVKYFITFHNRKT